MFAKQKNKMQLSSKDKKTIDLAKHKIKSTYKYHQAYRYIRSLIIDGYSNKTILKQFNKKHIDEPIIYSIIGGRTLSPGVLREFRRGVELEEERRTEAKIRFLPHTAQQICDSVIWKKTSIGYLWAIEQAKAGKTYKYIVDEFNRLHEINPVDYSTRSGKPLTSAILSNWLKEIGDDKLRPGYLKSINDWKKTNKGYLWFKEQMKSQINQDEIIEQFNLKHDMDPQNYSTFLGSRMTIQTFNRWKKDIMKEIE